MLQLILVQLKPALCSCKPAFPAVVSDPLLLLAAVCCNVALNLSKTHPLVHICYVTYTAYMHTLTPPVVTSMLQAESQGSDISKFRQAGIPVKVDHLKTHMHHK